MPVAKTFTIPNNEVLEYQKALDVIGDHWDIKNKSLIIRQCVYDVRDWIEGNKELVRNNQYDEENQRVVNKAYIHGIWSNLKKDIRKSSQEKGFILINSFIKNLLLVLEKVEMDNERLKLKYGP